MSILNRPRGPAFLIVLLISVVVLNTVVFSGTAVAQSESNLQWADYWGTVSSDTVTTQSIIFEPDNDRESISFGGDTGRRIRIQNLDTEEAITLTPTSSNTYQVTEFRTNFNDLLSSLDGGPYRKAKNPNIHVQTEKRGEINKYSVTVNGDINAFFEQTFHEYNVQLIARDGSVLAETPEPKIRAVGYESLFKYNGSAVAVAGDTSVQSDWYVVLTQFPHYTGTTVKNAGTEFVGINTKDIGFRANETFRIYVFPNESRKSHPEDIILSVNSYDGFEDADTNPRLKIVDEPVGSGPNQGGGGSSSSVPGFGLLHSLVALCSSSYMIYRRLTFETSESD